MSIDDQAEAMEQLDRDVCLAQRKDVPEETGECLNGCGTKTKSFTDVDGKKRRGAFCSLDCSEMYERLKVARMTA